MPFTPWGPALSFQASIGLAGYTLVNGTGAILTWSVPNDGAVHRFLVIASLDCTIAETGGAIAVVWTMPDGTSSGTGINVIAAGRGVGVSQSNVNGQCQAGTTVTVQQQTALTAGAAKLWADILGG